MSSVGWRKRPGYRGDPNYVTAAHAARIVGCHRSTIVDWADAGVVPCVRDPDTGYRVFAVSDLYALRKQLADRSLRNS